MSGAPVECSEVLPSQVPSFQVPPAQMYCLKCRAKRDVKDVLLGYVKFDSIKNGTPMTRASWMGVCCSCGKATRLFTKNPNGVTKKGKKKSPLKAVVSVPDSSKMEE